MTPRRRILFGGSPFKNRFSMLFDGVSESCQKTNFRALGNNFTLSLWVKTNIPDAGDGTQPHFISKANGTETHRLFIQTNGNLQYSDNVADSITADVGAWGNTWKHVAITVVNGSVNGSALYFNGASVASGTINYINGDGIGTLSIGSFTDLTLGVIGNIDEVIIFDAALNAAAINAIYNNGKPKDESKRSNIISYYRMGDSASFGTNWNIPDKIGSNHLVSVNMEYADRVSDVP